MVRTGLRMQKKKSLKDNKVKLDRKKILIITLVVLLLIFALFMIGSRVLGRAYFAPDVFQPGQAGIEQVSLPVTEGETFTAFLTTDLGASNSVGYVFEARYDSNILEPIISNSNSKLLSHWGNTYHRIVDDGNAVSIEHATLDFTKVVTGDVRLAELSFRVKPGQELNSGNVGTALRLNGVQDIYVYDITDQSNIITSVVGTTGENQCAGLIDPSECSARAVCNNNVIEGAEECDGTAMNSRSCVSSGFTGGDIACNNCRYDFSGCTGDVFNGVAWFNALTTTEMTPGTGLNFDQTQVGEFCTLHGFIDPASCASGIGADLNGDGEVNDGDVLIIQLAMLAEESTFTTCGADNQDSCDFSSGGDLVFVCENLKMSYIASFSCGGNPP